MLLFPIKFPTSACARPVIAFFRGVLDASLVVKTRPRAEYNTRQLAPKRFFVGLAGILLTCATPVQATYSIAAVDGPTGQCGIAVQTDNLAVGAAVPHAQAGVGVIASQFETNPRHGSRGLALLATGMVPADVLAQLLREDGNFEGRGIEARQIAVVGADGRTAVHTGGDAARAAWAGSRQGKGYSIQGNGLAGPHVLEAMEQEYLRAKGSLAQRLLAALVAGDKAGGQSTGRESAALLVRTREGFPLDIDLRVDHADDPVAQLSLLHDLQSARQQMQQARLTGRGGDLAQARILLVAAAVQAKTWPRACVLAAEVAVAIEQPTLALEYLTTAFAQNPARIPSALGAGTFAMLGGEASFHRWITPAMEEGAFAAQRALADATVAALPDERRGVTLRLLEAGHAARALAVLGAGSEASFPEDFLLQASVHAALGDLPTAIACCEDGLRHNPAEPRLQLRVHQLRSTAKHRS